MPMTEPKYKPILFTAPMVRAILEGRKTQTRRPVKFNYAGRVSKAGKQWHIEDENAILACPYGQPGDRLWVRESFIYEPAEYCWEVSVSIPYREEEIIYRADLPHDTKGAGWTPSIHMPRWASRITLEVTGVRVERLQEISGKDAIAEGLKWITKDGAIYKYGIPDADGLPGNDNFGWPWTEWKLSPVFAYKKLWEQINGPGAWDKNPWLWVVEFKRAEG